MCLAYIQIEPLSLGCVPDHLETDFDFVLTAVKLNDTMLQFASKELKAAIK